MPGGKHRIHAVLTFPTSFGFLASLWLFPLVFTIRELEAGKSVGGDQHYEAYMKECGIRMDFDERVIPELTNVRQL